MSGAAGVTLAPVAPDPAAREAFIRANTEILSPPHVPELRLHLASEAFGLWHRTEEDLQAIGLPPPYWAFAWAGGQALARYLLDHPHIAAGRPALDIGTGSGLAAIAAAKAGARPVTACDIDPYACVAAEINAGLNTVTLGLRTLAAQTPLETLMPAAGTGTLILLGDLFYERPLAGEMAGFARAATHAGHTVLVGDPGRAYLPVTGELEELACYEVPVTRALEDAEVRRVRVFRFVSH